MSVKQLKGSVTHAIHGVIVVFRSEQSFRIQVVAAALALIASVFFHITSNEFIVVILLIGAVLTLEMINSVFERIVDVFKPRIHPIVKEIKDIMAAAVLITSLIALLVGIEIFDGYLAALVLG